MKRDYAQIYIDNIFTAELLKVLRNCRDLERSFEFCLAEARKQFNREIREEALQPDRTPLTK